MTDLLCQLANSARLRAAWANRTLDRVFPTSLSPSRANDFMACPLLYRLRVIDKLPEQPSVAALRGTLVHAALEELFTVPAAQRTTDTARTLIAQHWDRMCVEAPEDAQILADGLALNEPTKVANAVFAPIQRLLDAYFTLEDPRRVEPHALEMGVSTELPSGLALRGYIDRVDVSPTGLVRLVDYKTGRSPGAGFEAKALFQMRFYALLWWRTAGQVPARLDLLYFGDGQRISYEPAEDELLATERKIMALSDGAAGDLQALMMAEDEPEAAATSGTERSEQLVPRRFHPAPAPGAASEVASCPPAPTPQGHFSALPRTPDHVRMLR